MEEGDGAAQFIAEMQRIHVAVGLPLRLRDAGVPLESLPELARSAMQQQRLLVNNPREVSEEDA
ncbi:iron-containing alcohol dehydrogenase, partial [Klebsiella pneumoniae]